MVVSGPELIEDIKKVPDEVLSLKAQAAEVRRSLGVLTSIYGDHSSSSRPNTHWIYWMLKMAMTWL